MEQPLTHDRNGDPVYSNTPLHMRGEATPTNRIRQDEQHENCVIVTDLDGKDDQTFWHANGSGQVPRLLKETFKGTFWQVMPYAKE